MNQRVTITLTLSPAEAQSLAHFVQYVQWEDMQRCFDDDDALSECFATLDHLRDLLAQAGFDGAPRTATARNHQ